MNQSIHPVAAASNGLGLPIVNAVLSIVVTVSIVFVSTLR